MSKISLVISDVDGTLVTKDKVLTERSRAAVSQLDALGIAFTIISSRPPFGMRMLVEPLVLRLPMGAYNGGALVMPDGTILEQRLVPAAAVERTLAVFRSHRVDSWLFSGNRWLLEDPNGANVDRETRTIGVGPTMVRRLEDHLDAVGKIVGVSNEFERLDACEEAARPILGNSASVARSQPYYLDVTPAGTDKGTALVEIARRLDTARTRSRRSATCGTTSRCSGKADSA